MNLISKKEQRGDKAKISTRPSNGSMATSKLVPIFFLSRSSQSGAGGPQKPRKGTRIEIPEVGERPARLGT